MKQHITTKQLQELNKEQMDKLFDMMGFGRLVEGTATYYAGLHYVATTITIGKLIELTGVKYVTVHTGLCDILWKKLKGQLK